MMNHAIRLAPGWIIGLGLPLALPPLARWPRSRRRRAPRHQPGSAPRRSWRMPRRGSRPAAREIAELTARIVGDVGVRARCAARGAGPAAAPGDARHHHRARREPRGARGRRPRPRRDAGLVRRRGRHSQRRRAAVARARRSSTGATTVRPSASCSTACAQWSRAAKVELGYRRDGARPPRRVEARPWSWAHAFPYDGERTRVAPPPGEPHPNGSFMRQFMADRWGDMELVALTPGLGEYFEAARACWWCARPPTHPGLAGRRRHRGHRGAHAAQPGARRKDPAVLRARGAAGDDRRPSRRARAARGRHPGIRDKAERGRMKDSAVLTSAPHAARRFSL
jgi:hypothetical protein